MELDAKKITIVHQEEKVMKLFDDVNEALKFADYMKSVNIEVAVDPLSNYFILYGCDRITQAKGRQYN